MRLANEENSAPEYFSKSDLERQTDSLWALPQISSFPRFLFPIIDTGTRLYKLLTRKQTYENEEWRKRLLGQ